ncbi:MAG: LCP family protein [Selenomonadaceae bacterium]|nr:LCP family protein [Selenomonadaceae bacterium]
MLMGVDRREDDVGRSDTLMIATIDPNTDQATLLSIPRDTRVKLRGRGYDKINAAYAYGGVDLAENTVENFLGIDIDHYVTIDTNSFVKIIDAIGGVDIQVEKRMYYEDPWDDDGGLVINLFPGKQHMDGKTAVTYVRYRDSEGDIGRVHRQQAFMTACMDKVTSPEIVTRIPLIAREIMDAIETDMSLRQILEIAGSLREAAANGLDTEMVPGYPLYIDDISYWIPDVEQMRISVADALGVKVDPDLRKRFERDAKEYRESIPSHARDVPEGADNIGNPVRTDERKHHDSERDKNAINYRESYNDSRLDNNRESTDSRDNRYDNRESINSRDNYYDSRESTNSRDNYYDSRESTNSRDNYYDSRESTNSHDNYYDSHESTNSRDYNYNDNNEPMRDSNMR